MKKKALLCLVITALLLSVACEIFKDPPLPTDMPLPTRRPPRDTKGPNSVGHATSIPPTSTATPGATPTDTQIVPPTNTPMPTPDPNLQLVSTKMQEDVWFTYPSELWYSTADPVFPHLQSKKYAECQVYLNNGHGMPDFLTATSQDEYIEGVKFSVTVLKPIGSDDIVFKSYTMEDFFLFTIENPEFEVLNEQCLKEAEDVLRYSIKQGFKPVEHHEPKAQTVPVVYTKDLNIWAYFVESDTKIQVTDDGELNNLEIYRQYQNPRVSPDGRFVAFEEAFTAKVYLYSFESGQLWTISDHDASQNIFDFVMGWDRDNQLYISRQHGACGLTESGLVSKQGGYVLRYDIPSQKLVEVMELPNASAEGGPFGHGFAISPSGRYISYYEEYCNPAWPGTAILYDLQTKMKLDQKIPGASRLSHSERYYAYPSNYRFEENQNIYMMLRI